MQFTKILCTLVAGACYGTSSPAPDGNCSSASDNIALIQRQASVQAHAADPSPKLTSVESASASWIRSNNGRVRLAHWVTNIDCGAWLNFMLLAIQHTHNIVYGMILFTSRFQFNARLTHTRLVKAVLGPPRGHPILVMLWC